MKEGSLAFAVLLALMLSPALVASQPTPLVPTVTLRSVAEARGIHIGAAVDARALEREPVYAETLAREFNMVTPEYVMKFEPLRPERGRYDFRAADALVTFAEANGMKVRGGPLVWGQRIPAWVTGGNFTRDELIAILREHILTVVGRYRGRIVAWDVVAEAIRRDTGALRDTFWLRRIGPEHIALAFRWAHEADPQARLFLNEDENERIDRKSDAVYALARDLVRQGVPIHGMGFQMHVSLDSPPPPQDVAANFNRMHALGLEVHVTEMDVRIRLPLTDAKLGAQASVYGQITRVCVSAPNCKALVLWGFTDRQSWIPSYYGPEFGAALIFDSLYNPKPAYFALRDALTRR